METGPGMVKPNGYVLWRGPSRLDGAPIVVIVTGCGPRPSDNPKTGPMLQTYILREDVPPMDAVRSGQDESICGECPFRAQWADGKRRFRSCYVRMPNGPRSVWAAFSRGMYPEADDVAAIGAGRAVRIGAYGDPGAVPTDVWRRLTRHARSWTGYSHQWRRRRSLRPLVMASTENEAGTRLAWSRGWRTFRARPAGAPLLRGEIDCPSSSGVQCADCRLCAGTSKRAAHVSIEVHGSGARHMPLER